MDDPWAGVTFEGAARAQLREQAAATPEQRLAWLEAALELAAIGRAHREAAREAEGTRPAGGEPVAPDVSRRPADD